MNANTQYVERRPSLETVIGFLSFAGILLAFGAGCQTSPASRITERENTTVPVIVPTFDHAKTVECWATLCKVAEDLRNALGKDLPPIPIR